MSDRPGPDIAARLLLALTALYVQRPTHTAEEEQQYIELALRLIGKVDEATRTAVADILQSYPDGPAAVLERLGTMRFLRSGGLEGGTAPDQHLVYGEGTLVQIPSEAIPAAGQPAPAPSEFGEAFFVATPTERQRLLALIAPNRGDRSIRAVEESEGIYEGFHVTALQDQIGEFTREFARLIGIPKSLCERILNDRSGEPMVVAAKATGMPIAVLQGILLLATPALSHSVQRVYELTELYHDLDRDAAHNLLALWRAQAKPDDPRSEA